MQPALALVAALAGLLAIQAPAIPAAHAATEQLGAYLAARMAGAANDLPNAAQYYEQILAVDPNNQELLATAMLFTLADGQVDKAVALSQRLLTRDAANATANLLVALGSAKRAEYAAAATSVQKVPSTGINRLVAPVIEAWIHVGQNNADAAAAALNKIAGNATYDPFFQYHSALINTYLGKLDLAEAAFTRTLQGGTGVRQMQAYSTFLAQAGRTQDAIRTLRSYLDLQPDNEPVAAALAGLEAGRKPDPLIADPRAGMAELLYSLAASLTQENATGPARNYARMAIFLRPDFDGAKAVLATGMEREEMWAEANAVLATIPAASPYSWEARNRVAMNFGRLGRVDEAVAMLRRMSDERKGAVDVATNLGDILRQNDRFAEAAAAYDTAVQRKGALAAEDWVLLYTRGTVLERSGQWDRAEADFLRALQLQPDQPYVLNYLGYSWIELGKNVEQATQMIQRAVAQQPTAGFIVDSLGWGFYKLGNYEEAARNLERAVQLTPGDSTINDHLGDAYWKVGRKREARFQWQRAIDLGPDPGTLPVLQRKLQQGLDG
jgi:tetratricopeptide (TPR) repeat protein